MSHPQQVLLDLYISFLVFFYLIPRVKQPLSALAEGIVNITLQADCQEQKTSQGVLVLPQPVGLALALFTTSVAGSRISFPAPAPTGEDQLNESNQGF